MGDDNKTIRSKINSLTVICENLWTISYFTLVAPFWLSAQAVEDFIENQLTNSHVKSVAYLSLSYGLKLHILLLTALLSLPINDLPYSKQRSREKIISRELDLIICIVARYFGQADLADN